MHFKKIIPFSLVTIGALAVTGALSACSDKVAGADEQVNTMAQNSSSSVTPVSSGSFDKNDFLARFGDLGVPVINITSFKHSIIPFKWADGSIGYESVRTEIDVFIDSINAREIYDNVVDSILETDFVPIDGGGDNQRYIDVFFMDENSAYHLFSFTGGSLSCSALRSDEKPPCGDVYEEYYSHRIEKAGDSLMVVQSMLIYDSSVVEQFKDECIADNGSFGENIVNIAISDKVPPELVSFGYKCSLRVPLTDSVYKDPYWKKYVSKVIDRCAMPVDFYDSPSCSDESEQ